MASDLLGQAPHIHISSVIFVISMLLMNVFACPYSFLNITVISVHFSYFNFCFKFCYPVVNIIHNHLYLLFLRSRKTNTKCSDKNSKTHSDIILAWLPQPVARIIAVSKKYCFLILVWALQIHWNLPIAGISTADMPWVADKIFSTKYDNLF